MATDFSRRGPQRWGCPAAPALCDALGVRAADGRGSVGLRGGCEASGRAGLVRSAGDSGGPAAGWAPGPAAGALSWRGGPGCGKRLLLLRGLQVRVAAGSVRGERLAGTPSRGLGAWAGSPPSVCSVEHQNLEGHYPRTLRPEKGYPVGEGFSPAPSHQSGQLPPAEPPGCSAAALAPSQTQTAEDSHSLSLSLSLCWCLSQKLWPFSFTLRKVEDPRSREKLLWETWAGGVPTGSLASAPESLTDAGILGTPGAG